MSAARSSPCPGTLLRALFRAKVLVGGHLKWCKGLFAVLGDQKLRCVGTPAHAAPFGLSARSAALYKTRAGTTHPFLDPPPNEGGVKSYVSGLRA